MFRRISALLFLLCAMAPAVELRVASLNVGAHWGTSYYDYGLGDASTADHQTVRAVLARIDADVVALQEIHTADVAENPSDLQDLADSLGYPYLHVAGISGAFDNTFRVVILSRFPFVTVGDIHSPVGAAEITRLHPVVKVDVPGTANDPVIVSVHLKSETGLAERFRRAVEMKRLVGYLADAAITSNDNFIVLGDFNPSSIDTVFEALPAGLPESYILGGDIGFPISYSVDPLAYFTGPGAARLDIRQLNHSASTYDTSAPGGATLDMILVSPAIAARPVLSEIYNSALDVSNDEGLVKAGSPLADDTSSVASDHYAVFADVNLDDAGPYTFTAPGQEVVEDFNGFQGNNDPAPWALVGDMAWSGVDDGSSAVPGLRSYGRASEGSLGFLSDGTGVVASAPFVNQTSTTLYSVKVSLDAEQWRSAFQGTADAIQTEIVTGSGTFPLPGLGFSAATSLSSGSLLGGVITHLETVVSGLSIPPGASFELRFTWVPGEGGGVASSDVFVNEFHYDNTGTDVGEFVEIAVAPGFEGDVSDISLLRYNGSNGTNNGSYALSSFVEGATTDSGHQLYYRFIPGLQNDTEGLAVVVGGEVRHFISYEGVFTATDGPAMGMVSTDVGVSQVNEPVGKGAICLQGTGESMADFDWVKFDNIAHSPGDPNSGQSFVASFLPPQGIGIDNLRVTFLTDADNDGQTDAYEMAFGTDPMDAASRFVPVITRDAGFDLEFPGTLGFRYVVEVSENLTDWDEWSTHIGNGELIKVPLPSGATELFFRVRAGG